MSSIIEGYTYDIFISYRQKDNKHDGWVTEFVDNLKGELESTFKEEISVYFDINLHDGLLETHDVGASLKNKLKCLVFIAIISRTYCDPKSFAWEHEFKAFVEQASQDQFGLKVKLPNGNVAGRVLPVRIYDLESPDIKLCETVLGGVLRGVEFIYREPGVNRPLRANEDNPHDNLNHTIYRNQINKVSNAIKEVITAVGQYEQKPKEVSKEVFKPISVPLKSNKTKIILGSVIALALIFLGLFLIPKLFKSTESVEKSIAVLPFKSLSDDPEKQYLADGMMDAITLHLSKIKDLRVMSRTSVEQYRKPDKSSSVIGRELDVAYLLEGSFQKFGDSARLIVQLIKTGKEGHTWANEYDRNWNNAFSVQSEVAQTIAKELYASITQEEKELIEKIPTANMTAYDLYLKANNYRNEYNKTRDLSAYHTAVNLYKTALKIDTSFAKAYTGLAGAYYDRYYYENYFKEGFLDSCLILANKALFIDDKLDEAYYIKGRYYLANGHGDEALDNYDKALKINPNYYLAYIDKGYILRSQIHDFVQGFDIYPKALALIGGNERAGLLRDLGGTYFKVGFIDKAKIYYQKAFNLDSNKIANLDALAWLESSLGNFEEALKLYKRAYEIDSTYLPDIMYYSLAGHDEESYLLAKKYVEHYEKTGELNLTKSYRVGYAFWQVGKHEEAKNYFNQQIKYDEESIKLGRDVAKIKSTHYNLAATYAFLGDKAKAYQYLDDFNTMNFYPFWVISLAKHDPLFASIRNEERFQKILQNMEAKYQAEHERVKKWLEEQGML
jgi:TolB-like protein/Tfp pilus assembly protein PilF